MGSGCQVDRLYAGRLIPFTREGLVRPQRSRKVQIVLTLAGMARSAARRSRISTKVMCGVVLIRPSRKARGASSFERRGWPWRRAAPSPVRRATNPDDGCREPNPEPPGCPSGRQARQRGVDHSVSQIMAVGPRYARPQFNT